MDKIGKTNRIVFAILLMMCFCGCSNPTQSRSETGDYYATMRQNEPRSGHIFEDTAMTTVAPFTVETAKGKGYYIVLDPIFLEPEFPDSEYHKISAELASKYMDIRFYVRGGDSTEISVPLGTYEVYYATGKEWVSEKDLFGPSTSYYKCNDTFTFEFSSNEYLGWTLTIKPTSNGNLDTITLDADEFPIPE